MSESKKKKEDKGAQVPLAERPLSQLLLDCTKDKYRLVTLATRWGIEIKQRDQSPLPAQELLNKALREILTGEVKMEDIEKLPPIVKVEKKAPEAVLKPLSLKDDGDEKEEKE